AVEEDRFDDLVARLVVAPVERACRLVFPLGIIPRRARIGHAISDDERLAVRGACLPQHEVEIITSRLGKAEAVSLEPLRAALAWIPIKLEADAQGGAHGVRAGGGHPRGKRLVVGALLGGQPDVELLSSLDLAGGLSRTSAGGL